MKSPPVARIGRMTSPYAMDGTQEPRILYDTTMDVDDESLGSSTVCVSTRLEDAPDESDMVGEGRMSLFGGSSPGDPSTSDSGVPAGRCGRRESLDRHGRVGSGSMSRVLDDIMLDDELRVMPASTRSLRREDGGGGVEPSRDLSRTFSGRLRGNVARRHVLDRGANGTSVASGSDAKHVPIACEPLLLPSENAVASRSAQRAFQSVAVAEKVCVSGGEGVARPSGADAGGDHSSSIGSARPVEAPSSVSEGARVAYSRRGSVGYNLVAGAATQRAGLRPVGGATVSGGMAPLPYDPDAVIRDRRLQRSTQRSQSPALLSKRLRSEFKDVRQIGGGSFSEVFVARWVKDDKLYAIKVSSAAFRGTESRSSALREVMAIKTLGECPYLVETVSCWEEGGYLYIMCEFCAAGSMSRYLDTVPSLDERQVWRFVYDICTGLVHMHQRYMLHLDLKPENILVTTGGGACLKIGDFGLAIACGEAARTEGDSRYLCREMLNGMLPTTGADIFALGVMLFEIVSSVNLPSNGEQWDSIRDRQFTIDGAWSSTMRSLVYMCLDPVPSARPDAATILNMPEVQASRTIPLPSAMIAPIFLDGCNPMAAGPGGHVASSVGGTIGRSASIASLDPALLASLGVVSASCIPTASSGLTTPSFTAVGLTASDAFVEVAALPPMVVSRSGSTGASFPEGSAAAVPQLEASGGLAPGVPRLDPTVSCGDGMPSVYDSNDLPSHAAPPFTSSTSTVANGAAAEGNAMSVMRSIDLDDAVRAGPSFSAAHQWQPPHLSDEHHDGGSSENSQRRPRPLSPVCVGAGSPVEGNGRGGARSPLLWSPRTMYGAEFVAPYGPSLGAEGDVSFSAVGVEQGKVRATQHSNFGAGERVESVGGTDGDSGEMAESGHHTAHPMDVYPGESDASQRSRGGELSSISPNDTGASDAMSDAGSPGGELTRRQLSAVGGDVPEGRGGIASNNVGLGTAQTVACSSTLPAAGSGRTSRSAVPRRGIGTRLNAPGAGNAAICVPRLSFTASVMERRCPVTRGGGGVPVSEAVDVDALPIGARSQPQLRQHRQGSTDPASLQQQRTPKGPPGEQQQKNQRGGEVEGSERFMDEAASDDWDTDVSPVRLFKATDVSLVLPFQA